MSSQIYYFKEVLKKVGITLQHDDTPNLFHKEQSLIIRDIKTELENRQNSIPDFISGVKYLTQKEKLFKKALLPSHLLQISGDDHETVLKQESIFRLLLKIDSIQNEIISLLLEEVTNLAFSKEEDSIPVQLLLNPLRYLSYLKDSHTLTTRLLDILEIAKHPVQLEILKFLPDIIPPGDHDNIAKKLSTMLETAELTAPIIDCLNHLYLSTNIKEEIQDHVLAVLNLTSCLKTFSLIFSFLIANSSPTNLQNILLKTRNSLNSLLEYLVNTANEESELVLTFEEIRSVTINSKNVSEGWINLINSIRSTNDHKVVDIIILLMLHSIDGNRKHLIKSIFKKKIKNGQLKATLLENTLQKYLAPQILKVYIGSIIEIANYLLRATSEPQCIEFSKIFYCTTFGHKNSNKQQRYQIIYSLVCSTGTSDGKRMLPSLSILETIAEQNLELLQPHTMKLMMLLDKIEDLKLGEVKQVYEILCSLIYGPKAGVSMEGFQNTIYITIRKQLSSFKKNIKYSGVIGAVSAAKNIALNFNEQSSISSDVSYSSISDLPNGPSREAARLLEQATNCISSCLIAQGLYYDQLAQIIVTTESLDKCFMAWLLDVVTINFEESYLSTHVSEPINNIPLTIQYNLNSREEVQEPIAVKIGELTILANENNNLMLIFAPLFRLLRLIHYRQNEENLSSIDALLGCGVILPEVDPDLGISSYDSAQSKQVVDCLFHCINWFREIINAFVNQKQNNLKVKVLKRLTHLIEIEELFTNCMKYLSEHKLPPSYFYNENLDQSDNFNLDRTKHSSDRGRKRKNPSANTTRITQSTQATVSKSGRRPQAKDKEPKEYNFREMDTDLMLLLKYSIITGDESIPESTLYLTLSQFKFILKDIVTKLNILTKPSSLNAFSHLITVKAIDFIKDCIRLMPHINNHLKKITNEIKELLKRSDGIHDSHEMFLQPATDLKICFSLILELKSLVLNWLSLQNKYLPLLREYLRAFVDESTSQVVSAQKLILEYLQYVLTFTDYCLTLPCAVHLVNIVKVLGNLSNDPTPKKKVVILSGKLLSIRWFNLNGLPETGAIANLHIDTLVKAHLNSTNLETMSSIISWIHAESSDLKSKDDILTTFPSISKANFPILYRGVCTGLLETLQTELQSLTNQQHLDVWLNTVTTMRNLMDIVKVQETKTNLGSFLKKSMAILKVFLSQGLPIIEIMLRSNSEKCMDILKTLQQTTRFIHNLCCHSKVTKDSALIAHIPQMRLTTETLVYRVKAALVANNCSSAFWMGTLKNKDLRGEQIFSQSTNSSQSDQQEDDEDELPADEDSDDETMLSANSGNNTSDII